MAEPHTHYHCVGVGVGPANLSLASLLHPHRELTNLFLERRESFGWHDGQQIPGASLQVSMLKDLVSLSDPTNPFSFLSYLHQSGHIYHFINAQFDAVPRQEFRNYLEWASRTNENIVFGETVHQVEFDRVFVLRTSRRTITADNVSIGIGHRPWVPPFAADLLGPGQFHVSEFVERGGGLGGKRVCVVGGGQSGAEAFLDLISRTGAELPRRVTWISRRRNFFPIDDSPFTNDLYTPGYSDHFFSLSEERRARINHEDLLTSDGVSEATLRQIYQGIYTRRFIDGEVDLVALYPNRAVTTVRRGVDGWELELANADHPGTRGRVEADVVVWATGQRHAPLDLLQPIAHRFERAGGEYRIDRDFAVCWDGPEDRNVFLLNAALGQRGLADKNLSLNAWRSRRVIDRLLGTSSDEPRPGFIEWSSKYAPAAQMGTVLP
jgi:lysine N6-hydroxylase